MIHAPASPPRLPPPESPSPSAQVVRTINAPLQKPGVPTRLRRIEYGGPTLGLDVRLYFDRHILAALLAAAEASVMGRAMIDGPALVITPHRGGDGNAYEVWALVAAGPCRPEPGPLSASVPAEPFPPDAAWDVLGRPVPGTEGWLYGKPGNAPVVKGDRPVRMYLDAHVIRELAKYAREALTGRVQLDHVGLVVEEYVDEEVAERFAVWTITCGGAPRPEPARFLFR